MKPLARIFAFCFCPAALQVVCAALYQITDLGTLGGTNSAAYGINDLGQVVGSSQRADGLSRAFRWVGGEMLDLGALQNGHSAAFAINIHGVAVGSSNPSDNSGRPVIFRDGTVIDLAPELSDSGVATSINDAGEIVGTLQHQDPASSYQAAYRFAPGLKRLGQVGFSSSLNAINQHGRGAGASNLQDLWVDYPRTRAAWWDLRANDQYTRITDASSEAYGVNNQSNTVGKAFYQHLLWQPTAWTLTGESRLSGLAGREGVARAINDAGTIVGQVKVSDFVFLFEPVRNLRATLWTGTQAHYLDDLIPADSGWELIDARGINNKGQIVGTGIRNKQQRAFLLDPLPAPGRPLSVRIASPLPDSSCTDIETLQIRVEAADEDGSIERVELFLWDVTHHSEFIQVISGAPRQPLATLTSPPWIFEIPNPLPGRFALLARATDDHRHTTYTREEVIFLNLPPVLRVRGTTSDGSFRFQAFTAPSALQLDIEASTNLIDWAALPPSIQIPEADPREQFDAEAGRFQQRFYRVRQHTPSNAPGQAHR